MTEAEAWKATLEALRDPDESSMTVVQDIMLEQGWKLWEVGDEIANLIETPMYFEGDNYTRAIGTFTMTSGYGVEWVVDQGGPGVRAVTDNHDIRVAIHTVYKNENNTYRLVAPRDGTRTRWTSVEQARSAAAREAWGVFALIKRAYRERWSYDKFAGASVPNVEIPAEINPAKMPAKDAFWSAVVNPDPGSMEVAQDIALENGWKLWKLGEERSVDIGSYFGHSTRLPSVKSYGSFWYTSPLGHDNGVEWKITAVITSSTGRRRAHPNHVIEMFFEYQDLNELEQWQWESSGIYDTVEDASRAAARYAWYALKVMKQGGHDADYRADADRIRGLIEDRQIDTLPPELNPAMTKNPDTDDLERARAKYVEFHRYDPKDVGAFPSSFTIPKRMLLAGKAKWMTYRSKKTDPSTLKLPKQPIDYIHEHDAGVMTYLADANPDTDVPEKFRDVGALVRIGSCLGFCVVDCDGEEVEVEGASPLPEWYCTPDGKCLYVIQDRKKVLAMSWGGALGVFARGVDG